MIKEPPVLPRPDTRWVDAEGRPVPNVYQYFRDLDAALRAVIRAQNGA